MPANKATMKQIAVFTAVLVAASISGYGQVLISGKGGNWALPTYIAVGVILVTCGFVLMIRAQRAQGRGH